MRGGLSRRWPIAAGGVPGVAATPEGAPGRGCLPRPQPAQQQAWLRRATLSHLSRDIERLSAVASAYVITSAAKPLILLVCCNALRIIFIMERHIAPHWRAGQ